MDFVWRVFQHMTDNLKICLKTNTKPKRVYVTAFDDTKVARSSCGDGSC